MSPLGCQSGWPGHMQQDFVYSGVKIAFNLATNGLTVIFNPNSHHPFEPESYVADSREHVGDGSNTGVSYTASCNQNSLKIRRVGLLKAPLVANYVIGADSLGLVEGMEGDSFTRICQFAPVTNHEFLNLENK